MEKDKNKEKLNDFIGELRELLENANWGVSVTGSENKPVIGQEGKTIGYKAECRLLITVSDNAKKISLKGKSK